MFVISRWLISLFNISATVAAMLSPGTVRAESAAALGMLMNHAEYHISADRLESFSSSQISIRICDRCDTTSYTMTGATQLQEYRLPIDLKRATELYLRKSPTIIFIGINRSEGTVDYVNFGGHPTDDY